MLIVKTKDAMFHGPRVCYFESTKATTPEEALVEAREAMFDWGQERLDRGEVEVTIFEVSQVYVLKEGIIKSDLDQEDVKSQIPPLKLDSTTSGSRFTEGG